MLIPVEVYLEGYGGYQMSLNSLISFKDKIFDRIKHYEDNKYTQRMLEREKFMNPAPSVHYWWHCSCLIKICKIILEREDCDDKLKKICQQNIDDAYIKIKKGLYND